MFEWSFKYLISQLIASSSSSGWKISHVLQYCVEAKTSLASQFIFVQQFLQQRLFERITTVSPELINLVSLGCVQCHLADSSLGWRSEVIHGVLLQSVRLLQRIRTIELSWIQSPGVFSNIKTEQRQYVGGRLGEAGQDIDCLGREVSSLLSSFTESDTPARVLNSFSGVRLVKNDQVTLGKCQERRSFTCKIQRM